jgi:hypothetical protein
VGVVLFRSVDGSGVVRNEGYDDVCCAWKPVDKSNSICGEEIDGAIKVRSCLSWLVIRIVGDKGRRTHQRK